MQITPLVLWVAGGLGSILWGVLFTQNLAAQNAQRELQQNVTRLLTSQHYDRGEIDSIKDDVKGVQAEVRVIATRLGAVEARR